jgi:DNA-binding XRE family transcriptional regulator
MPKGIPNDPNVGRGGYKQPLSKDVLRERIREIEARIKQIDRRDKALGDLKKWLANRKLEPSDLMWMVREMRPKRADKPVTSKRPLQPAKNTSPGYFMQGGKLTAPKGDPEFRRRIQEARRAKGWTSIDVGKKIGVSHASITSWEAGRYVPREEQRAKIVKVLELPAGLGAAATKAMEASQGGVHPKGNAAAQS